MKLRYITSHYPREMLAFVPPIFNDSYDSLHHWQPPGKKHHRAFQINWLAVLVHYPIVGLVCIIQFLAKETTLHRNHRCSIGDSPLSHSIAAPYCLLQTMYMYKSV